LQGKQKGISFIIRLLLLPLFPC